MEHISASRGVAQVITQRLETAGISQRSAAVDTGIPLTTLHRRLTGQSSFGIDELSALAGLLETTISELIAESESAA